MDHFSSDNIRQASASVRFCILRTIGPSIKNFQQITKKNVLQVYALREVMEKACLGEHCVDLAFQAHYCWV